MDRWNNCCGSRQKNGYFTVMLTIKVDLLPPAPPPYGQLCFIFIFFTFNLRIWLYVLWKGFYPIKKSFVSNYKNYHSSILLAAALSQNGWLALWKRCKENERCIFETLHSEIKCVLSIKQANLNEKVGQNFHLCLWPGPRELALADYPAVSLRFVYSKVKQLSWAIN